MTEKTKVLHKFLLTLKERENSQNTIEKYVRDIRKFLEFVGDNEITKHEVLKFKETLIAEYKVSSVNSMIAAVNVFLKFLGKYDCTVKRVKVQTEAFRDESCELTVEDYKRLLSAARRKNDEQLVMIMQTICATGIRVSELAYFTVETINQKVITVFNKGKSRTIILPNKLVRELKKFCAKYKIFSGHIFKSKNGSALSRKAIWSKMKGLCKESKVDAKKIFPHNLRHLFAKTFYKIKKDLVGLACIFGHSSINTTRKYLMPNIKSFQNILNSMSLIVSTVT